VSERRAHVFLLDVQTRRGEFETQTQPKDVFELFEEKRRARAIAQGATARRREQSCDNLYEGCLATLLFEL